VTKLRLAAVATAVGAAVLLAVLYWKTGSTVHAPPPSLAPLRLTEPAKPAPTLVFAGAGGKLHGLGEFRGRLVLLNLWATWCAPCVQELPALAKLEASLPPGRFVVVAVDVGRDEPGDAAAFLKAHGAGGLAAYVDANAAMLRAFGAYGLPMSVLIDANGREIARAEGPADWSAPDSIAWFKRTARR